MQDRVHIRFHLSSHSSPSSFCSKYTSLRGANLAMGTSLRPTLLRAAAIATCITARGTLALPQLRSRVLHGANDLSDAYDYVIVGGGTAGLTLGDRLSEDAESELRP